MIFGSTPAIMQLLCLFYAWKAVRYTVNICGIKKTNSFRNAQYLRAEVKLTLSEWTHQLGYEVCEAWTLILESVVFGVVINWLIWLWVVQLTALAKVMWRTIDICIVDVGPIVVIYNG